MDAILKIFQKFQFLSSTMIKHIFLLIHYITKPIYKFLIEQKTYDGYQVQNVDPAMVFKFAGVDSNAIYLMNQQNSFI